jgi:hypothetical protein
LRFCGEQTPPGSPRSSRGSPPSPCRGGIRKRASVIARIVWKAPGAPAFQFRRSRKSTEGARDAKGPNGPTGLDASRHRGLSKSCPSSRLRATTGKPQVRQVPRRPARGVFRFAPRRSSVVDPFVTLQPRRGAVTLHRFGPGNSASVLLTRPPAYRPSEGLGARLTRQDTCGLDRRAGHRISDASVFPGHRSPPRVWRRLIRHPSVTRDGIT